MSVFTEAELVYLGTQRLARLATASAGGQPDVSVVGFSVDGDTVESGGLDLTKTVRFRHLQANPRATLVVDDLPAWSRGHRAGSRFGAGPRWRRSPRGGASV